MTAPLVAANWKMHGSAQFVADYAAAWQVPPAGVDVVLCPPWPYLQPLTAALAGRGVRFGAQSVAVEAAGAFTGEASAEMASDLGAEFAIVGHSERRTLFGETDDLVAAKFASVRRAGLIPILCVGESAAERRAGQAESVVRAQLDRVLARIGAGEFEGAVVAYEPVWAIGTGASATPDDASAMHAVLRRRLVDALGALADSVRVVYGGSVRSASAPALFAGPDIDGALVGGASLDAAEFAEICSAAATAAAA